MSIFCFSTKTMENIYENGDKIEGSFSQMKKCLTKLKYVSKAKTDFSKKKVLE